MRNFLRSVPYIYYAYSVGLLGILLIIVSVATDTGVLQSAGIALFAGAFVGAGFQFVTSSDLWKLQGNVEGVLSLLRDVSEQATSLSKDLRVARVAEREGIIAIFPSRDDEKFVGEVKEQVREASELWVQSITGADFFGSGKVFHQAMRQFIRRGGTLNALLLNPDSPDFEARRRMNQPDVEERLKSILYIDHLQSMATLEEWKDAYGNRVKIALLESQPSCWVFRTSQIVLLQQYHNGYPDDRQEGDDFETYRKVSHHFPVLQFSSNSPHFTSISNHLVRTVEIQGRARRRSRTRR